MGEELFNIAITNGLFAALFVALLLFTLKDTSAREKKYGEIISDLSKNIGEIETVKQTSERIENKIDSVLMRRTKQPKIVERK